MAPKCKQTIYCIDLMHMCAQSLRVSGSFWHVDYSPPGSSVIGIFWSGFPFPPPGDLPNPGIEPSSPGLAGGFYATEPPGKPIDYVLWTLEAIQRIFKGKFDYIRFLPHKLSLESNSCIRCDFSLCLLVAGESVAPRTRLSKEKMTQSWLGSTLLDKSYKYYNVNND